MTCFGQRRSIETPRTILSGLVRTPLASTLAVSSRTDVLNDTLASIIGLPRGMAAGAFPRAWLACG
jgi:hypothetical protein